MFSHDPFQNYQTLGAYGTGVPYGLPYQGIPTNVHPMAYAGQQYPQLQGLQNPLLQHPLAHAGWQNPLVNPLLAYQQMLAQQTWQQPPTPFNYPLAPQGLIGGGQIGFGQPGIGQQFGQPGIGQQYGQINPLVQMALRQLVGY